MPQFDTFWAQAGSKPRSRTPPAAGLPGSQPAVRAAAHKKSRFASMSATTLAESGGLAGALDGEHTSPPNNDFGKVDKAAQDALQRQPKESKAEGRRRAKAGARAGAGLGKREALWPMPSAAADIFGTASADPYTF